MLGLCGEFNGIVPIVVWDTDAWTVQGIQWPNAYCCMGHRCLDCAGNSLA